MQHAIIGYGEVGKAISEHLRGHVTSYDLGEWEGKGRIEFYEPESIVHVCIPYNEKFMETLKRIKKRFSYDYMVIHSTLSPDENIIDEKTLYSPVLGRHEDDFGQSIKKFKKYYAGKREVFDEVSMHIGLMNEYWGENAQELAYAKVMSTAYMYHNLIYQKQLYKDCKKRNFDFNKVYKRWNRNYNDGFQIDHPEFTRPVYSYVKDNKPGGHCLGPNTNLIENDITAYLKKWENSTEK